MREMAGKLADQMSGELTAPEMQAVLEKHNGQLAQLEDKMLEEKEKQRRSLLEKLAQNRQKKLAALRWRHEQMVCFFHKKKTIFGVSSQFLYGEILPL